MSSVFFFSSLKKKATAQPEPEVWSFVSPRNVFKLKHEACLSFSPSLNAATVKTKKRRAR